MDPDLPVLECGPDMAQREVLLFADAGLIVFCKVFPTRSAATRYMANNGRTFDFDDVGTLGGRKERRSGREIDKNCETSA